MPMAGEPGAAETMSPNGKIHISPEGRRVHRRPSLPGSDDSATHGPPSSGPGGGRTGRRPSVGGSETSQTSSGSPFVVVVESGDGRVVAVSDEWFLYNSGSGAADISTQDNGTLVDNIWAWTTDLPL